MMLQGDYYPQTPYSLASDQWIGWQFNRPEQGDGVVQAFRRADCSERTKTFRLKGLDPAGQYEITNFDGEGSAKISGEYLLNKGLAVEINEKPGAAVIVYRCVKGGCGREK